MGAETVQLATVMTSIARCVQAPCAVRDSAFVRLCRSPAEGAYSEGFIKAKFTQDYGIECPSTGSVFSLQDGSILSWYPTNPVLRAITPQDTCRKLEIFPVRLTQVRDNLQRLLAQGVGMEGHPTVEAPRHTRRRRASLSYWFL